MGKVMLWILVIYVLYYMVIIFLDVFLGEKAGRVNLEEGIMVDSPQGDMEEPEDVLEQSSKPKQKFRLFTPKNKKLEGEINKQETEEDDDEDSFEENNPDFVDYSNTDVSAVDIPDWILRDNEENGEEMEDLEAMEQQWIEDEGDEEYLLEIEKKKEEEIKNIKEEAEKKINTKNLKDGEIKNEITIKKPSSDEIMKMIHSAQTNVKIVNNHDGEKVFSRGAKQSA